MQHPFPNFLLIGAAKAGTSSLHVMLDQHPDLFMLQGERKFFARDDIYANGWDWYAKLFQDAAAHGHQHDPGPHDPAPSEPNKPLESYKAIGEGSNHYTMAQVFPNAPERIAADLPDARLIYLVRDPIKRIESYYLQLASQGDLGDMKIDEALRERPERFVDISDYTAQIDRYRARFDPSRIHVAFAEELRVKPAEVLNACFAFLGLDPLPEDRIRPETKNQSRGKKLDTGAMHALRKLPAYKALRNILPKSTRTAIKTGALQKQVDAPPRLSPESRARVIEQLADRSRDFLARHGRPQDLWDFSPAPAPAPAPTPKTPQGAAA